MLKYRMKAIKIIKPFATYWFCLLFHVSFSQSPEKQTILVEKMEYAYNSSIADSSPGFNSFIDSRIVLVTHAEIADKMMQSILTTINNRWNATILNPQWNLKMLGPYNHPKFKTNLKKGTPGSWHLFFQVVDNGPYPITEKSGSIFRPFPAFESLDDAPYYLKFKVQLTDGSNGTTIFSNEMMVEMQRTPLPAGQLLLRKLPALTDSFLQAFDTAVQTLFAVNPQSNLKLDVAPACLFLDTDKILANAQRLNFVAKNDSIIELLQLKQEWVIQNTKTRKTKRVNNFGNNLFNSTLNSLTGMHTDKIRAMGYVTKFGFVDTKENAHYFCEISFLEETREERERVVTRDANGSKSNSSTLTGNVKVSRTVNPEPMCYLIREKDTVGYFRIIKGDRTGSKNNLSQFWDGQNESTISSIPDFWNNSESSTSSYFLEGELNNVHFIIESGKAGNQIDIEIDNQEIMTLKTYNTKPVFGLLYPNPVDEKALSVIMMLSTMPFSSIF